MSEANRNYMAGSGYEKNGRVAAAAAGGDSSKSLTSSVNSSSAGQLMRSKPIRRRSRASKRTPTTLLNADATNFRALVQEFTGCPPIPFATTRRGPINLSFEQNQQHNFPTTTLVAPSHLGNSNSNNYQQHLNRCLPGQHYQLHQDQPCRPSLQTHPNATATATTTFFHAGSGQPINPSNLQMPDGLVLGGNTTTLEELVAQTLSDENHIEGYF
ncbi:hypothetical protein Tsubulata_009188 [Turnera subulata]|uniref:VQ domain-containing protein n=1 Tax=Turnera subulata TaxID=218843 RepID=A0A9Q0FKI5_9ROSI|nr:hypothetical protein Tsubulata_009188 [Turnera subulata]